MSYLKSGAMKVKTFYPTSRQLEKSTFFGCYCCRRYIIQTGIVKFKIPEDVGATLVNNHVGTIEKPPCAISKLPRNLFCWQNQYTVHV